MLVYSSGLLNKDAGHPLDILTKAIAGATIADRSMALSEQKGQQAATKANERMRIVKILRDHEDKNLSDDFTYKSLRDELPMINDKETRQIVTTLLGQYKPKASGPIKPEDPMAVVSRTARAKSDYINAQYGQHADPAQYAKDPNILFFDSELKKILAGQDGYGDAVAAAGSAQDQPHNPGSFEELGKMIGGWAHTPQDMGMKAGKTVVNKVRAAVKPKVPVKAVPAPSRSGVTKLGVKFTIDA